MIGIDGMPDSLSREPRRLARLRCRALGVPVVLGLITFLAFLPVFWNDFVAWDDQKNLYENPDYRGLGWKQLRWMFTTNLLGHYIPLTWLSFGLDYRLWGMRPAGYHLTNLLLHIASTALVYFVTRRLLEKGTRLSARALGFGAAVAALFFAIHPLRVESVAWATERRDVLSGALFLLTIFLYLRAAEADATRRRRLLSASIGSFVLALAAKSIVMTLPVVLIVLDVYPLRRLQGGAREWLRPAQRAVLIEKTPYLVLGVVGAAASYYAQAHVLPRAPSPWLSRAAHVAYGLWFHVLKTVVPTGLSPLYEAPARIDPWEPRFLASLIGVVGVSVLVLGLRRRWPAGLALWTYYGVMLGPVSGVIPMGSQLTADRYSYLACLGWAVLVGAGAGALVGAAARGVLRPSLARLAAAAVVAWLIGLGALTWSHVRIWQDTESLWRHAVAVTPDCALCHKFFGDSLLNRGALLSGLAEVERAVALRPDRVEFRFNVGVALTKLGLWPEAVEQYRLVLARHPDEINLRVNLAVALVQIGRAEEAVEQLEAALRLDPDSLAAHVNLGWAFNALGRFDEAISHFRRATELKPDSPMARLGLVRAYLALGREDAAREQYEVLRAVEPRVAASVGALFGTD